MLLSIECAFIKNRSTFQGQTITGNCCTHAIGWTRWYHNGHIFDVETDFARQFDLPKVFVSDGKTGHLRKVCNNTFVCIHIYFCKHSYADRRTHFAQ